jgi:3-dehydroquinate dehydratase-1
MTGKNSARPSRPSAALVAVIASPTALARATRLHHPPDLFELRLDALRNSLGETARTLPKLRAPLLLTARHPAEGGLGQLRFAERRALLQHFLENAAMIDLELRSVDQMKGIIGEMNRRRIGLLISFHDLRATPSLSELHRHARFAAAAGAAIFKVVTRTDREAQLSRLIAFFEADRDLLPIAAMGIGKLGLESRYRLDQLGSALSYASLGRANIAGQPSLSQLRRARRAYTSV